MAGVSFTGSVDAGRAVRAAAGMRPAVVELGSSSPNIVHADADLDLAVRAITKSAFTYAGQLCTSAQRVLVHEQVRAAFVERLLACVDALVVGDPAAEGTDVGPMISEPAAQRAQKAIHSAVDGGATLACGGTRTDSLLQPTVLLDPSPQDPVVRREAFAPLVNVLVYHDLQDAIALANDTPYGLAAGVFTESVDVAFALARGIEVGTVNINDASGSRVDRAPFAGVKNSGSGCEGIPYALRSFVYERLLAFALREPAGAAPAATAPT